MSAWQLRPPEETPTFQRLESVRPPSLAAFSLIEVMVAASLLLLTVLCVTPLLVGSRWTASRQARASGANRLAASTLERLDGLAFGPSPAAGGGAGGAPESVVAALFPHADPGLNRADDFLVTADGGPWPLGSFVTRRQEGPFAITTESRFGVLTDFGLVPVSITRLAGYDSSSGGGLPSGALLTTVRVSWVERGADRVLARRAVFQQELCGDVEAAAETP